MHQVRLRCTRTTVSRILSGELIKPMFLDGRMMIALTFALVSQSVAASLHSPETQIAGASSDVQPRAQAYEKNCVSSLRTLNTAQITYWGGDPQKGYARSLKQLGPKGEGMIESV